jgi:hypothetical protein
VTININIARDFSTTPGPRSKQDGLFSGEEFREMFLEKYFSNGSTDKIIIDLDGVEGYSTAFLEEALGGLVRKYGKDIVRNRLEFISTEEPFLINEIKSYIEKADKKRIK